MGYTLGDAIIVFSLAGTLLAHLYFRHLERQRRLDIVHEERVAAMERRLPLAELCPVQRKAPTPVDSKAPLMHAIVWAMLTGGAMLTLAMMGTRTDFAVLLPAVAAVLSALGSLACEAGTLKSHPAPGTRHRTEH